MSFSFQDAAGNQYTLLRRDELRTDEHQQVLTPTEIDELLVNLAQTPHGRALLDVLNKWVCADTPPPPPSLAQELGITQSTERNTLRQISTTELTS